MLFTTQPRTPWINTTSTMDKTEEIMAIECNKSTGKEMLACIRAKTYSNKEQIIDEVLLERNPDIRDFMWHSFYAGGIWGFCHTLIHLHPIGTHLQTDFF